MLNDSEESLYILLSLRAHIYWPGLTGHQYYEMGAVGATLGSPAIEKGGGHNALMTYYSSFFAVFIDSVVQFFFFAFFAFFIFALFARNKKFHAKSEKASHAKTSLVAG